MLEATSAAVEEWMLAPEFDARLFCYFPCADLTPDLASQACLSYPGKVSEYGSHRVWRD